jgi:hypothetical protein
MRDVMRHIRSAFVAIVMAIFCTPAFSTDPLTLLLLRMLRDKIISVGIESAAENVMQPRSQKPAASSLPGLPYAGFDDAQLRRLIDEGFVHLSAAQRGEVYVSVQRIIADPKNASDVPGIIAELAIKASGVRQAHEQLNALPMAQKRQIAAEARAEYEKMPVETREQMASVLRQRLVPLPADLTDMILSEFDYVRARTVATPSVATATPATASVTPTPPVNPPPGNTN